MKYSCVWSVVILSLLSRSFAQSGHIRVLDQTVVQQQASPVAFVKWRGSSATMKNISDKTIASFVFVCVVRNGKAFSTVDTYDSEEGSTAPGGFRNEWGFDATPLNACRSWKGLLAVGSVTFSDGTSWQTSLVPSLAVDRGTIERLKLRDLPDALHQLTITPDDPHAQRRYLYDFPDTYEEFLHFFDLGRRLYDGHEYVDALSSLAQDRPENVGKILVTLSKDAHYNADAPAYLQVATSKYGSEHPQIFVSLLKVLPIPEQMNLITFLADVENHDAYPQYQLIIDHLKALGQQELAKQFETARTTRSRHHHH